MIKIRKLNTIYRIDKAYVDKYVSNGFVIVEEEDVVEPEEDLTVELTLEEESNEETPEKSIYHMKKEELIELAKSKGIKLTGKETYRELQSLFK